MGPFRVTPSAADSEKFYLVYGGGEEVVVSGATRGLADLFAAAPEMAEALSLAVEQMERFGMTDVRPPGFERSTYQVAKAALAKARRDSVGETTACEADRG